MASCARCHQMDMLSKGNTSKIIYDFIKYIALDLLCSKDSQFNLCNIEVTLK